MTELEMKIYEIVRGIPMGCVATYGQVALAAGDRRLARMVGNVMHKNPMPFWELARSIGYGVADVADAEVAVPSDFEQVPCHRVVNAEGKMGANFGLGGPKVQAAMLRAEGVEVGVDLRIVDLERFAAEL